jgi:hypothetical protein
VGAAVKARVLNGLGFLHQALSLVPRFFQHKPRRGRRWQSARRACRRPAFTAAPYTPPRAMAHADAPDPVCPRPRWATTSQAPCPHRSQPDRPVLTSTVVASWPPTNATRPTSRRRSWEPAPKARDRRNAGCALCQPRRVSPRRCPAKSLSA